MISIIIPTLNEEKVLEETLQSLKRNLTLPHEIIISDGGSSDKTVSIAKKYTRKVAVYSGVSRQTIAAGRNAGAAMASGDYLIFLDADCQLENADIFLRKAQGHFEDDPDLTALTTNLRVFAQLETLADRFIFELVNLKIRLMNNYFGVGESVGEFQMIRRSAFQVVGGFRNDLVANEDFNMFNRLSKIGHTFFEPNLIVYHTGRRAHQIGWPKLLSLWMLNYFYFLIFDRAYSKEWVPLR
ncbi:MAG TPA: glycosyltransferase [Candidatus Paceibacterota bacterium]|nr:glycosyltransferase [Candidatus Paceibacterota bacterium]